MKLEKNWRVPVDSEELKKGLKIPLDIEELKQLPKVMQDCYNGLCKYAKPARTDYLWLVLRDNEEIERNVNVPNLFVFDLFVAVGGNTNDDNMPFSGSGGSWFVWFNENKDYNLTGQERIALRDKSLQYIQQVEQMKQTAKNYMGEGVTKCVLYS